MKHLIVREAGENVYEYISKFVDDSDINNLIVSTSTAFNIEMQAQESFHGIINLKRTNDIRRINKLFEAVNAKLEMDGIFISCVETYSLRKRRILSKYPPVFNYIIYTADYLIKRASPKIWGLKQIYFFVTAGRNRVLSKAETLGRLYSCGFKMVDETFMNNMYYFVVQKVGEPAFDYNPTYGPLISLNRVGKNGKMIKVYKMRTMHAYSEYLQSYIYKNNDLEEGGKFKDDFRITTLGKIMRKFWIDELPMFLNVLKGELKIVGVRPLSAHYLSLYREDLKVKRLKSKPGLVPPFYYDMPSTLDEIMDSEERYLDLHKKHPLLTDWRYFWKAFYNIFFKRARSR
jgi:lipopolysaccharide/colanic/teichoic acid biosynthesis glycosyltransferase